MVDLNPHLLLVLLVKRCSHRGKQHGRASKSYRELGHVCVCVCVRVCTHSCLTLCNPMDCSAPGSSIHAILQARILE